ncbi:MAG: hypothetical protein Q8K59_06090 [Nitrosomonas sp.]|nr:hypothetical protein [Nitrosomonas sp.]MDP1950653.1 hypothetical protein [Nitrosomonas sp.]
MSSESDKIKKIMTFYSTPFYLIKRLKGIFLSANVRMFCLAVPMLGLLASCVQPEFIEAQKADILEASQETKTSSDHDTLAKYYENIAKEMRLKAEERKKQLLHYKEKSYLYGGQGQVFQAHTSANIRNYERAVRENLKKASLHREMAAELTKHPYTIPTETSPH